MIIIRNTTTNIVREIADENALVQFAPGDRLRIKRKMYVNVPVADYEIVTGIPAPTLPFIANKMTYADGVGWAIPDEDLYLAGLSVPETITPLQGQLALIDAGVWASVEPTVDAITDSNQKAAARAFLDRAETWRRSAPTIAMLAALLSLDSDAVDLLFKKASLINP